VARKHYYYTLFSSDQVRGPLRARLRRNKKCEVAVRSMIYAPGLHRRACDAVLVRRLERKDTR